MSGWTTFGAVGPALAGASILCATLGVAFWATVALSAIPSLPVPSQRLIGRWKPKASSAPELAAEPV